MNTKSLISVAAIIFLIVITFFLYTAKDTADKDSGIETTPAQQEESPTTQGSELEASADILDDLNALEGVVYSEIFFDTSFIHTKPGEYSDVIVNVEGMNPGEFTIMYLRNAETGEYIESGGQQHTANDDGKIDTQFRIYQYGSYEVFLSHDGKEFISDVIVVE